MSEMDFYKGKLTNLNGCRHQLIYCDYYNPNQKLNDPHPRAALLVSNNLNCWKVEKFTNFDMACARIDLPAGGTSKIKSFYAASVYFDINDKNVISPKLKKLVEFCKNQQSNLLLFCDSNCHCLLYGNDSNQRGEVMTQFILNNHLKVLNKGDEITYHRWNSATQIDVCLATNDLATYVDHFCARGAIP